MSVHEHSELPKVWISFDHGPVEDDATFYHEGRYIPDGLLPFEIDDCAGTVFTMDGVVCELLGDLGGHAIYRRRRNQSALYTMNWEDFAEANADDIIELHNY